MDLIPDEKLPTNSLGHQSQSLANYKIEIKTLQHLKQLHEKNGQIPVEHIREFLCEPNISADSQQISLPNKEPERETRDVALIKGGKFAENIIQKQTFLEINNYFDPSKYFGGLDIPDLDGYVPDERLDDMFLEYLPTEMEEKEEVVPQAPVKNKNGLQEKIMIKTVKLIDKENCSNALNVNKSPTAIATISIHDKAEIVSKSKSPTHSYAAQLFKKKIIPQDSSTYSNTKRSKSKTPSAYGSKRLNGTANSKDSSGILNTEASLGNKSVKSSQELPSFVHSFMSPGATARNSKTELAKPKSCNSKLVDKVSDGNTINIVSSPRSCIKLTNRLSPQLKTTDAKSPDRISSHRTLFTENSTCNAADISNRSGHNVEKQALNSSRTQNSSNERVILIKSEISAASKRLLRQVTNKNDESQGMNYKSKSANPSFVEDPSLMKRPKASGKTNPVAKGMNTSRQLVDKSQENYSIECTKLRKVEPKVNTTATTYLKHPKIYGYAETSKNSASFTSNKNVSITKILKPKVI